MLVKQNLHDDLSLLLLNVRQEIIMMSMISSVNTLISTRSTSFEKKNDRIWHVVETIFWAISILFDPIIDYFTQGISDFLALETLRHGTSIQGYIGIRINGTDLKRSGVNTANFTLEKSYLEKAKGHFFVSKDSKAHSCLFRTLGSQIFVRCLAARAYCGFAGFYTISGKGIHKILLRIPIVVLNILFVPTVKFRFIPEEIAERFENDPDNVCCAKHGDQGLAYRTKRSISTDHIGLKGILLQTVRGNTWARMKAHPIKVLWGLVKLINPIGVLILLGLGAYLATFSFIKARTSLIQR